jgi:alpha-tubulin suppressor-like RCC1 family protein
LVFLFIWKERCAMVAKKSISRVFSVLLIVAFMQALIDPAYIATALFFNPLEAMSSLPQAAADRDSMFMATPIMPHLAASSATVVSIWGGARGTIVLKSDGTVWAWGYNNCPVGSGPCGKIGDGTTTERDIPVQVHGPGNIGYLTSITAIMGGEHTNYALKSDGVLWAWGGNFVGQLGDGTYTNKATPVQVSGLTSVTSLGGRGYHSLAVKSDGTIWAWGWNERGQLGHDTSATPCPSPFSGTCSNIPVQVVGISNPLAVTGGGFFSLALMPDHTLKAWGANEFGQLGDGSYTDSLSPVNVSNVLSNVVQVSAGWKHAVARTATGEVWTWGNNTEGAIGNGVTSTTGVNIPFQVPGFSNVLTVSGGDRFTAILKSDGTVWTWGDNTYGQLGDGTFTHRPNPVQVVGLSNVILMSARDYHVLAVKSDGTVWAWGSGKNGELGNNDNTLDRNTPVQVLFPAIYTISGNAGVGNAILTYPGGTTTSAADTGNYSFTVNSNWTGPITPSKTGYIFLPPSINIATPVTCNIPDLNFIAKRTNIADFDDDGKTDAAKFVSSTGNLWYIKSSTGAWEGKYLGTDGIYVRGSDFDGDGKTDPAKFVASTGTVWYIKSSTGNWGAKFIGADGTYVPGVDLDGDGKTDPAKFVASTGTVWYLKSNTGTMEGVYIGSDGQFVSGSDFDGDGKSDLAKYVSSVGAIWYLKSSTGTWEGKYIGSDGTYVSGADFDGDGKSDPAKFVPSAGEIWYLQSGTGTWDGIYIGSDGTFVSSW